MISLFHIAVVVASFFIMEFAAWFSHKYLMHGPLWFLHKDHHQKEPGFFEKNDAFFLLFAVPSWLFIMFGMMAGNDWRLYFGLGILIYGFAYFIFHEVFIHQRFSWFRKTDSPYFRAMRKAHYVHHRQKGKLGASCFGMLFFPMKYLREELER